MKRYIALLRGINVSGQKKILMPDLREHLQELSFKDVQTYIQSGNFIFRSEDSDTGRIEQSIEQKITEKYGFEVPVLVEPSGYFQHIIQQNPYTEYHPEEENRLYVVFLYTAPSQDLLAELKTKTVQGGSFTIWEEIIYLYHPGEMKWHVKNET